MRSTTAGQGTLHGLRDVGVERLSAGRLLGLLKTDRKAGVLRVPGAFAEPGVETARVAAELAGELREMAAWLELDDVVVGERGDLAAALSSAL